MLEILQRMSPEARRNYQAALTREKMEYEKRQQGGSAQVLPPPPPPPLPRSQAQAQYQHSHIQTQQQARHTARQAAPSLPAPPQQKVPSVLDDPAIMASVLSLPCVLPRTTPANHHCLSLLCLPCFISQDQAVNELFSWIKAVIWTIEQHAIRAARAQMEAKGVVSVAPAAAAAVVGGGGGCGSGGRDSKPVSGSGGGDFGKGRASAAAAAATWTPKATPDGAKMRAMMRTVGIDVAPA
jgi:hypothetical protein